MRVNGYCLPRHSFFFSFSTRINVSHCIASYVVVHIKHKILEPWCWTCWCLLEGTCPWEAQGSLLLLMLMMMMMAKLRQVSPERPVWEESGQMHRQKETHWHLSQECLATSVPLNDTTNYFFIYLNNGAWEANKNKITKWQPYQKHLRADANTSLPWHFPPPLMTASVSTGSTSQTSAHTNGAYSTHTVAQTLRLLRWQEWHNCISLLSLISAYQTSRT